MSLEVGVQIAPAFAGDLSADELGAVAEATLRHEGVVGEVTLVITDDQGIQELNRDFSGNDTPTDVLAFSAREEVGAFVVSPEMGGYLGDVIVSYPRAASQAREQGHSVQHELYTLVVHGVLHLLGYDHASDEEKSLMWARQGAILRAL
jgi:probable rRNA maturation factor